MVAFKSKLSFSLVSGKNHKSCFYRVRFPGKQDQFIRWKDHGIGVQGTWRANTAALSASLYETDKGSLQWNCYQPSSTVSLKTRDSDLSGLGYVE